MQRLVVPWNELKPADVIVACNGTLWFEPYTVVSTDVADGPHFKLTTVAPSVGVLREQPYAKNSQWLVERSRGVPLPRIEAVEGPPPRTVHEVKEWCLATLTALAAEFGAGDAIRMIEERWFGSSEDPDGRPLSKLRREPVTAGFCIVRTCNSGRSGGVPGRDEKFVAAGIPDGIAANLMCESLNDRCSGADAPWFYKVELAGYQLLEFTP